MVTRREDIVTLSSSEILYRSTHWALIPGGHLGIFWGGYVPRGTPNWHPVLKTNSPKIDTPF